MDQQLPTGHDAEVCCLQGPGFCPPCMQYKNFECFSPSSPARCRSASLWFRCVERKIKWLGRGLVRNIEKIYMLYVYKLYMLTYLCICTIYADHIKICLTYIYIYCLLHTYMYEVHVQLCTLNPDELSLLSIWFEVDANITSSSTPSLANREWRLPYHLRDLRGNCGFLGTLACTWSSHVRCFRSAYTTLYLGG